MSHPPEVPEQEERWVYGGIRVLDDKRVHAWIDPAGRELLYTFSRAGGWAIGSYYTARVTREGPSTRLHGAPAYLDEGFAEVELRRELWAKDTAARSRLARLTQERKEARRNAIDEALAPLIAAASTLRTGADRDAFTAYVMRRLIDSWSRS